MLNCASTIGVDIRNCQSKGIKVVLSLGGAVGSYGFTSDAQATQFAGLLWDMVFEGNSSLRPFGEAVLDGVDLDIEGGSTTGYPTFVKAIRSRMQVSKKTTSFQALPNVLTLTPILDLLQEKPWMTQVLRSAMLLFSFITIIVV